MPPLTADLPAAAAAFRRRARRRIRDELRDLAPGRRLRLQLGLAAVERHAAGAADFRVLDAGSEEGLLCLRLARRHPGWSLVAADIAEEPLRRGRQWAREQGLAVQFVRCDLTAHLGDGVYDAVVALESLVEIPDDRAAMRRMAQALAPGGVLVAQVPTATWTPVLPGAERSWRREARHGYEADDLRAVLEELGLTVRELRPTFHRLAALAQDVRDRVKHRGVAVRLPLLPVMAAVVRLERLGVVWGAPRSWFVVATANGPRAR